MIFQCNGGPGGRSSNQDESYSEEDEEESSTSVENSEGEDEEEDDDDEEEESDEEDSNTDDDDENDEETEEEVTKKRATRNSGPMPSSSSSSVSSSTTRFKMHPETEKGRVTRLKAKQELPTKRLLRSRKKSPVAGAGSKVLQVFKCPKCKKEFNNKVSLSRHTGWCKQKKVNSPRKKKGEEDGDSKNNTPKKEDHVSSVGPQALVVEKPSPPSGPRGRGRPRKNPVPSTPSSSSNVFTPPPQFQVIQQPNPHHQMMTVVRGATEASSSALVHEEFMQQKSPESSPGLMDTSSEEDYEQKEFAANAHQLISHRNNSSVSIDVVNPDPPGQTEGPVTCTQCKMTYRTLQGFQNHIPNCSPLSSDEEEDDVDVVDDNTNDVPQFQRQNGPNWIAHQTVSETIIAPPQPEPPMVVESSDEEESTSSSDDETPSASTNSAAQAQVVASPQPVLQNSSQRYHEISIVSGTTGRSPLKIILPPDNTPQVINSSGLTLERLGTSPAPRIVAAQSPVRTRVESPVRTRVESPRKCATPIRYNETPPSTTTETINVATTTAAPPVVPPPPVFHPTIATHPSNNTLSSTPSIPPSAQSIYSLSQFSQQQQPIVQHVHSQQMHPPPPPPLAAPPPIITPSPAPSSKITTSAVGGNPPTYTQAQLMPGTVLHNTTLQVPQQMSTSTGEAYHLHQQVPSQPLTQFPGSHFPLCYTSQAAATPQSTPRVQTSIPAIQNTTGLSPHSGIFIGGSNAQQQHQLQMSAAAAAAMVQSQILRQTPTAAQQQIPQFSQQIPTMSGGQPVGQLPVNQGGISAPGQQHTIFGNGNSSLGQYGIPPNNPTQLQQSGFTMSAAGPQFQQGNSHLATNALAFSQIVQQQLQQQQLAQQHQNPNPQQLQVPQQQQQQPIVPSGSHPSVLENTQQLQALQSQLQQQYQQQQYFQSVNSNLPKISDNLTQPQQQLTQQLIQQQQTMFNGLGLQFQLQQLQQRNETQVQHAPPPAGIFQQTATTNLSNTGQLPPTAQNLLQTFNSQSQQSTDGGSSVNAITGAPSHQPVVAQPHHQTESSNVQQGMELNLQQQVQLQQQQQQFLALQQQMQVQQNNTNDPNRPQFQVPQNLQAMMMNAAGSLQWTGKPGQPPQQQSQQQIQVQIPPPPPPTQIQQQTATTAETIATGQQQQQPNNNHQQPQQTGTAQVIQVPQQTQQQPQTLPQVIQQLAQVTDNAGNTYIIIAPTQPQQQQQTVTQNGLAGTTATGSNASQQLLSLLPGLQALPSQQIMQQRLHGNSSSLVQCSAAANGMANHSPGTLSAASSGTSTFHSVGRSAPCPCATCKEKMGTTNALEKYKRVLPYPSANDSHHHHHHHLVSQLKPLSPKQPVSIRPAVPKQPTKVVRVQAAAAAASTRPTLQLTLAQAQQNTSVQQSQQLKLLPVQPPVSLIGVTTGGTGTASISSSNIAVVRPMENPLQRLSDQISQIESTFLSPPSSAASTPPLLHPSTMVAQASSPRPHLTLVTASPPPSTISSSTTSSSIHVTLPSTSPSQPFSHVITLDPPPMLEVSNNASSTTLVDTADPIMSIPMPRLGLVDHGVPAPLSSTASSSSLSPQLSSPSSSIQSISAPSTPGRNGGSVPPTTGVKRKVLQVSPTAGNGGPRSKNIKLMMKRGADTYSIDKVEGDWAKARGSFKSLKIRGTVVSSRLTSPQEGTATNVVVMPYIRILPNPNPEINEGNITISEDEKDSSRENDTGASPHGGDSNNNNEGRTNLRLTHRAVVVWEVRMESNNTLLFQSGNVLDVWDRVFEIVQGTRLNLNLPPIFFPATNIALPQNEMEAQTTLNNLALTHKATRFLLQQLPGLQALSKSQQNVKSPIPSTSPVPTPTGEQSEEQQQIDPQESDDKLVVEGSASGCARFERFTGRKAFDMFGWLTSKHRDPLSACDAPMESLKFLSAPIGMRYRKLKDKARYLVIKTSEIHGRGLFTKRDVEKGEMMIEYAGEVIRPHVCDMREKYYGSKSIGCYMFRINDHVIDATMKGNAARFINHSCEPNCEARAVKVSGKDRIIIFSVRRIQRGEELTYDYSFEKEEEKIICTCKSNYCRKYLN